MSSTTHTHFLSSSSAVSKMCIIRFMRLRDLSREEPCAFNPPTWDAAHYNINLVQICTCMETQTLIPWASSLCIASPTSLRLAVSADEVREGEGVLIHLFPLDLDIVYMIMHNVHAATARGKSMWERGEKDRVCIKRKLVTSWETSKKNTIYLVSISFMFICLGALLMGWISFIAPVF